MTYQPIGNKLNKIQQSGGYQPLNIRYETIPTKEQIGKGEAFTRAAAFQAVPTTGAIASGVAGAKGGALLGSFAGPIGASVGAVVGGVGGGILGAVLTSKAQEKALEIVKGNEWMTKKQEQLSQARKDQPLASFAGEVAPQLLTLKPSPKTVGSALKFAQNILTNPKSVTAILKTPAGRAQLDDLVNVSIGGSAELGTEVYTQAKEGDFNALRLIAAGTVGSLINQPNRFGMRLGMKPSGEIEFTPDNVAPDVTPRLDVSAEAPVRPQEAPQQALKAVDDTLIQEARKYKSAEEFVKDVMNNSNIGLQGEIKTIPINKIKGTDYPELDDALLANKKLSIDEAEDIISATDDYKAGQKVKYPIEVIDNGDGTYNLIAGNHRLAQKLINGETDVIANISNVKGKSTKSQLEEIWKKANQATPESSLINEAKKYKSAEEFVKAKQPTNLTTQQQGMMDASLRVAREQNIPLTKDGNLVLYHGTQEARMPKVGDEWRTGSYFTSSESTARQFAGQGGNGKVVVMKVEVPPYKVFNSGDGTYFNSNEPFVVKSVDTKSQLTDIWEQANEITPETRTTSVPREQLPVSEEGETRVSRLEARMKSVLNNISPEKADEMGVTTYQRMNKDEQIKLASDYVSKNPEDAMAVLRGEKEAPVGLLYNSIALALEETSTVTADANLAIKLASLRSTRAGQEISILTKADPNNPVSAINEIIKARKARVERKTKTTASKAISKEVSELSAEVAKKQLKLTEAEALLAKILC